MSTTNININKNRNLSIKVRLEIRGIVYEYSYNTNITDFGKHIAFWTLIGKNAKELEVTINQDEVFLAKFGWICLMPESFSNIVTFEEKLDFLKRYLKSNNSYITDYNLALKAINETPASTLMNILTILNKSYKSPAKNRTDILINKKP